MKRLLTILSVLVASVGMLACTLGGGSVKNVDNEPEGPGSTVGDEDSTFDHDNSGVDPFDLLKRLEVEGPPIYAARMHGCPKLRYETLGTVLDSLGVDLDLTDPVSAGQLYRSGYNALGGANYAARVRENIDVTTSAASRTFDVFAAAAPEIIANISTVPRCQEAGVGPEMFDVSGNCTEAGITCLLGVPATDAHIEICNLTVTRATTPELGQELAVATLLAAAHTCE